MIVILKRDDLLEAHGDRRPEDLRVSHFKLAAELIERADVIVFVEGPDIKFLKNLSGIQSQDSIDVLMNYITSSEPTTQLLPFRPRRPYRRKKPE